MKPGQASQTAAFVCAGRALAHARSIERFSDPTALALLPDDARARVESILAGVKPRGLAERFGAVRLDNLSKIMVARTRAIDDAVRDAAAPQLVILGAGFDGRAWRMPELGGVVVFEVDHPDSQRDKRARVASLSQTARDVRFVPVDFARDDLDAALAAAGHDPTHPTTWIWEGVVMYLTSREVESSLALIARRSAPGSSLIVLYHAPGWMLHIVRPLVKRVGEPLRSTFTAAQMRELLRRHGFQVRRDEDLRTIGTRHATDVERATRFMKHMRIVIARRG